MQKRYQYLRRSIGLVAVFLTVGLLSSQTVRTMAQKVPAAVSSDPTVDAKHPTSNVEIAVPSHGEQLYGIFYLASGAGPHPTALVLHGFPGYEQQLDLAQALRRAGWNVLALHYRGSWGVHGNFSFTHAMEDSDAEVAFLERDDMAAKYKVDRSRIVVIGHSMGGYMAASAGAHNSGVAGIVMIGTWNIGSSMRTFTGTHEEALRKLSGLGSQDAANYLPLSGCTPESLNREIVDNYKQWDFVHFAPALASRPVLLMTADDGSDPDSTRLLAALHSAGAQHAEKLHTATDHGFSDHRIFMEATIINWLAGVPARPAAAQTSGQ
jgi:dipeptidyl aminopeptidase/acylaminoacyl peptidase